MQTPFDIERLNRGYALAPFIPQKGPQMDAWFNNADVLLYGGAAGGGKTALACALSVTCHREVLYIRREAKQLDGVVDEMDRLLGSRSGYNSQTGVWRVPAYDGLERKVTLGSVPHLGDEQRYQGRPRDLLVIDEAANMLEMQVLFLQGWVRTVVEGQRCRTLLCSNPPTSAEGEWIIRMFAPWLDTGHPNPAAPGELRWFAMLAGKEIEVDDGTPFEHNGEEILPQSRSFIPARVQDNAYLMKTGYVATLQALPEPLRSQMLYGDFTAGREDAEWQCIPSDWVRQAQDRWVAREFSPDQVTSLGVDPSRGGRDQTVIAQRVGWWYAPLAKYEGAAMENGAAVAGKVIDMCGSGYAPVHVDVIGIGTSVVDQLDMLIQGRCIPVNSSEKAQSTDFTGSLKFVNRRAEMWWRFRDALNPDSGKNVALPPDTSLRAELCAPKYMMRPGGIAIEKKEDIIKRLGRSTDSADAVIYAALRTPILSLQH